MATFYSRNNGCIVFTNLKVMFSTLSQHEVLERRGSDRRVDKHTYISLLARKAGLGTKLIFLFVILMLG
jgi:hypothetical protein